MKLIVPGLLRGQTDTLIIDIDLADYEPWFGKDEIHINALYTDRNKTMFPPASARFTKEEIRFFQGLDLKKVSD